MKASVLFAGALALFIIGLVVGDDMSPAGAVGLGLMWMGFARI